jgi:hypothetical protein
MVIFLGFVLAVIALAFAIGLSVYYTTTYSGYGRRPRRSRLTYEQYQELKTWGVVNENES